MSSSAHPHPAMRVAVSVTHGAALTFETVEAEAATGAPRVHPIEDVLMRVISGVVRLTLSDHERLLHTGDEAIVPAGEPHRIAGVDGEARLVMGFRAVGVR